MRSRGPSISQTDARKPPCRGRREPSTPRGRTRAESRASGRHGPRRAAPRRDADRSKTGHALTSRPPRATGMCVLTAVRARVALVSRLSRPPGPGAPPGVTKSRMRIQVPACPPAAPALLHSGRQRPTPRARSRATPVICAFAVRCRREQADGIPVAETGMPNFDSGYDLRPGYGSKVVTR